MDIKRVDHYSIRTNDLEASRSRMRFEVRPGTAKGRRRRIEGGGGDAPQEGRRGAVYRLSGKPNRSLNPGASSGGGPAIHPKC